MPINLRVGAEFDERSAGTSASGDDMKARARAGTTMPPFAGVQGTGSASGSQGRQGPQVVNHITYNNNGAANAPTLNDMSDHLTRQYERLPGQR